MVKKFLYTLINTVSLLIIVAAVAVLVLVLFTPSGRAPQVLGYTMLRVTTGSMEPTYAIDTLIVVKKEAPSAIQEGDIISFYSSDPALDGAVNTHRVTAAEAQPDGSYLIACSADLDDMYDLFQVKGTCDAATVSGWVMEEVGKVPEVGDHFQSEGLDVTVTKVEHRRVLEIQVRVLPHEEEFKPREWELRGREKDTVRSKRAPQKPEP